MFKSDEIAIASVIDKYVQTINNADTTLTAKDGKPHNTKGIETQIFKKESMAGNWFTSITQPSSKDIEVLLDELK